MSESKSDDEPRPAKPSTAQESERGHDPILVLARQSDPEWVRAHWCRRDRRVRIFRCNDCFALLPACRLCLLIAHASKPLHAPHEWAGIYWKRVTLTSLGYWYQKGHDGSTCPNPAEDLKLVMQLGVNGMHRVWERDCECPPAEQ
ncbi:hypothetical protein C8F04DRAFT_1256066 [Mycena alexandri]|uniref:Uncharacterized protein n=1 Tax=Mycena alexandri TaxID=1745969 RepID=A0AAD6XAT9_9AGAR|nr:hypothetical protein C8F04DRAFT_1256066 [Mycena alexandri]